VWEVDWRRLNLLLLLECLIVCSDLRVLDNEADVGSFLLMRSVISTTTTEGSATISSRCGLRAAGEIGPSVCKKQTATFDYDFSNSDDLLK
jgi:hypothetical protein